MRALFAFLLLSLLAACAQPASEQVEATAAVPVTVAPVRQGAIHATLSVSGIIKPAAGADLVVTAPQPARIAAISKGIGERVRRGDVLVRFEIPSLESDAAARRSDLQRARARLTQARAGFERVQGLFARGIAAGREVEDARRELTDAEAGVSEAQSAQTAAGRLAGRAVVRAPFDGVVAERTHNPGDLVEPSDPILRLLDPARLQAEAAVPIEQLAAVPVGSPAQVRAPGGEPLAARVLARPASVDPATATAALLLAFARPPGLPAGTPVQVEIAGREHPGAVIAPGAAVVQEGPESFVYTVDAQNKAHRVPVRLGVSGGNGINSEVEILAGVAPDARVIVEGHNGLPDGAEVLVQTPQTPPPAGDNP